MPTSKQIHLDMNIVERCLIAFSITLFLAIAGWHDSMSTVVYIAFWFYTGATAVGFLLIFLGRRELLTASRQLGLGMAGVLLMAAFDIVVLAVRPHGFYPVVALVDLVIAMPVFILLIRLYKKERDDVYRSIRGSVWQEPDYDRPGRR